MQPHLLEQMAPDEPIASVSADGAYDTKACHAVIAERGAAAVIPPGKNVRAWKDDSAGARVRNDAVAACKRLGRGIWKVWSGSPTGAASCRPRCTASSAWASG